MEIKLLKMTSEPKAITKTWSTASADIKTYSTSYAVNELDVMNPRIVLADSDVENYNYMYIAALGRYYYIRPTITAEGYYTLNAHCDVLMSHATQIRKEVGILARSSDIYNTFLTDEIYNSLVYRRVQTLLFDKTPFSTSGNGYYLTVTGGNPTP